MDVINLPQEIFRKIASLSYHLESHKKKVEHKGGHLLVDLSSGAMGFTYVRRGEMEYQQNLHVGLIRMKEYFTRNEQSSIHFGEALREYIRANLFLSCRNWKISPSRACSSAALNQAICRGS